jgi:hypothetical protein
MTRRMEAAVLTDLIEVTPYKCGEMKTRNFEIGRVPGM